MVESNVHRHAHLFYENIYVSDLVKWFLMKLASTFYGYNNTFSMIFHTGESIKKLKLQKKKLENPGPTFRQIDSNILSMHSAKYYSNWVVEPPRYQSTVQNQCSSMNSKFFHWNEDFQNSNICWEFVTQGSRHGNRKKPL